MDAEIYIWIWIPESIVIQWQCIFYVDIGKFRQSIEPPSPPPNQK